MLLLLKGSSAANQVKVGVLVELIWVILELYICALKNKDFHDQEDRSIFFCFLPQTDYGK